MGRLAKNIGLTLLFLVAVLILLNIFVLMPLMRLTPEQTSLMPGEEITESVEPAAAIIAVDTLAVIRKDGIGEGVIYIDPEDESLRNPFFWPEEKAQKKKVVEPAPAKPQLSMVIIGEGRRQALLGDAFVQVGDMYHGYLVQRIEENHVVLVDDLGELRIFLAPAVDKEGHAQPPPGLIER
ncbi:MAG: hypothetical protein AMJ60_10120 [Desulfobacterales bacterium SG8_35]|nr:MAG: hypothetical protein AMJ60_10120 [Desulfobacterales bacterium SG8_35]